MILAALAVSLGPFAAGLSKGYMSPAIASMQDAVHHNDSFTVSDQQASWIASLSLLDKFYFPHRILIGLISRNKRQITDS
ncbi:unnamed protein product [Euphydryas editha]|uniref:ATP synthase F0 subunit 6 n=1 Tax=Euphydryas editha TaxID=104508 RepID=A0AAU9UG86_EUPED|nr:unnamed protein product [Euphydryas editha]